MPQNNEIACIHTGENGIVPINYDFKICLKEKEQNLTYFYGMNLTKNFSDQVTNFPPSHYQVNKFLV